MTPDPPPASLATLRSDDKVSDGKVFESLAIAAAVFLGRALRGWA